jgi:hypothetical protein
MTPPPVLAARLLERAALLEQAMARCEQERTTPGQDVPPCEECVDYGDTASLLREAAAALPPSRDEGATPCKCLSDDPVGCVLTKCGGDCWHFSGSRPCRECGRRAPEASRSEGGDPK